MDNNETNASSGSNPLKDTAPPKPRAEKAIPDKLKVWLIASLAVLLGSLLLFVTSLAFGFVYFTQNATPLWVTALGVAAVLGMALGFTGLGVAFLFTVRKTREVERRP
jgi:uncharacterized RDD family membrane protein YckC